MYEYYEFSAQAKETIYGIGSEFEAELYLKWLNRDGASLYQMNISDIDENQANTWGIDLRTFLLDIGWIEPDDD